MATIKIPYADPGVASFEELDTYTQQFLLNGAHPPLATAMGMPMANDTAFDQFSVVGLDDNGDIALATTGNVDPADDIVPVGVLAHSAALGATGTQNAQVWYTGHFNIDALVYDASFDTDVKKLAAFDNTVGKTTIAVSKR
jgi:hypothetical protein